MTTSSSTGRGREKETTMTEFIHNISSDLEIETGSSSFSFFNNVGLAAVFGAWFLDLFFFCFFQLQGMDVGCFGICFVYDVIFLT